MTVPTYNRWVLDTRKIQTILAALGFYKGVIDDIHGPLTEAAITGFKKSKGLRARPYIGPITTNYLRQAGYRLQDAAQNIIDANPVLQADPKWVRLGRTYLGLAEISGNHSHNPRIVKWFADIKSSWIKDDEQPWCAAAVGGILTESGLPNTGKPNARSYIDYGQQLEEPALGCIVVFWRGRKDGWQGHVAFVVGKDQYGRLMCMGGNQNDEFNIKPFSTKKVLSYNYPIVDTPINYNLPLLDSEGHEILNDRGLA